MFRFFVTVLRYVEMATGRKRNVVMTYEVSHKTGCLCLYTPVFSVCGGYELFRFVEYRPTAVYRICSFNEKNDLFFKGFQFSAISLNENEFSTNLKEMFSVLAT